MKHLFLTLALMLSLFIMGGCSNDDEPGSGSGSAKGEFKVDGKKVSGLNYAYYYVEDDDDTYYFCDKDLLKYVDWDYDELDFEFNGIEIYCNKKYNEIYEVVFDYKVNPAEETGVSYGTIEDKVENVDFSIKGKDVKFSSNDILMEKYIYSEDSYEGEYTGSFSASGTVKDLTDMIDEYSRGADPILITDPKQVAFLKSLNPRHRQHTEK